MTSSRICSRCGRSWGAVNPACPDRHHARAHSPAGRVFAGVDPGPKGFVFAVAGGRDCGTANTPPPRHPSAPCDVSGRKVVVFDEVRGHVMFRYDDDLHGVYLGELDPHSGVVNDVERTTLAAAKKIFRRFRKSR